MSTELSYLRGAFIANAPRDDSLSSRVIPFRFNPESLQRQVTVEAGQTPSGTEGAAARTSADPTAATSADAAMGALKESFSVQIRLDFADRDESVSNLDEEYGIAPEIAAIEDLLYPVETDADASSDGKDGVRAKRARPSVLFVWGKKRVLPVRIASLAINESVYNNHLNPVRAEIDVSLEVLSEADVLDTPGARSALEHTNSSRQELARMYYENTASQSTNYPSLG
ncbi:MAG: hypothetical protein ACRDLN_08660 [Solirubrobacteraceae bacterium]